ncbi:MAG: glycosyltransferase, partial [Bacillota bacterium]
MAKTLLSFVIPCYRSENTVTGVVEEIILAVSARQDEFSHEIILVNDGSPDGVADVIAGLCRKHPQIVFVNLSRNFGQHSAVMAGFAKVRGQIVVCLDDDGQTPADECLKLVDKLNEGYDIVFAEYVQPKQSLFRILGSRFNTACNRFFFGQPKNLKTT